MKEYFQEHVPVYHNNVTNLPNCMPLAQEASQLRPSPLFLKFNYKWQQAKDFHWSIKFFSFLRTENQQIFSLSIVKSQKLNVVSNIWYHLILGIIFQL
jgi:hypothetical protein